MRNKTVDRPKAHDPLHADGLASTLDEEHERAQGSVRQACRAKRPDEAELDHAQGAIALEGERWAE